MVKYIDIMRGREDEIGKLVKFLSDKSKAFTKPPESLPVALANEIEQLGALMQG